MRPGVGAEAVAGRSVADLGGVQDSDQAFGVTAESPGRQADQIADKVLGSLAQKSLAEPAMPPDTVQRTIAIGGTDLDRRGGAPGPRTPGAALTHRRLHPEIGCPKGSIRMGSRAISSRQASTSEGAGARDSATSVVSSASSQRKASVRSTPADRASPPQALPMSVGPRRSATVSDSMPAPGDTGAISSDDQNEVSYPSPWHGLRARIRALTARELGTSVQAKLTVGGPGDRFEQEADEIAERVAPRSGPRPAWPTTPASERAPSASAAQPGPRSASRTPTAPTAAAIEGRSSQPLASSTRRFFEPRMGVDLSGVRIHHDSTADGWCRNLHAVAFTLGRNIAFRRGAYAPGTPSGRHLLAHELTHVLQQSAGGPRIQAQSVAAYYGRFTADHYGVLRGPDRGGDLVPVGVEMLMSFHPGPRVNASKIGFVQVAQTIVDDAPFVPEGEAGDQRAIGAEDARPGPAREFDTDEGTSVDRPAAGASPVYIVDESRGQPPPRSLSEGESEDTVRPHTAESRRAIEEQRHIFGARYRGYGSFGHREGPEAAPVPAVLHDGPRTLARPNGEQVFETAAVALDGVQAGQYYGSVEWGWRRDGDGRFRQRAFTLRSQGTPSATFLAAAQVWNRRSSDRDRPTIALPAPDIHAIAAPGTWLFAGPDDEALGIAPLGYLTPGTRVSTMSGPQDVVRQIRVDDFPPITGSVDGLEHPDLVGRSGTRRLARWVSVYQSPNDAILGIPPVAVLPPGLAVRIDGRDPMAPTITADARALMGRRGYVGNLRSTHTDERPTPTTDRASSATPATPIHVRQSNAHAVVSRQESSGPSEGETSRAPVSGRDGTPYPQPILPEHVVQRRLADCYLLASLWSLASRPEGQAWLRESVRVRTDGGYVVRLFVAGADDASWREQWYAVGRILDSHPGAGERPGGPPDESRWVQAIEIAYAELRGAGRLINIGRSGVGGRLFGGAQAALQDLTGRAATRHRFGPSADPDEVWGWLHDAGDRVLVAGTGDRQDPSLGVYSGHNYAVLGTTERDGHRFVRLANPWGHRYRTRDLPPGGSDDAVFEVTVEQFVQTFIQLDVGEAPALPTAATQTGEDGAEGTPVERVVVPMIQRTPEDDLAAAAYYPDADDHAALSAAFHPVDPATEALSDPEGFRQRMRAAMGQLIERQAQEPRSRQAYGHRLERSAMDSLADLAQEAITADYGPYLDVRGRPPALRQRYRIVPEQEASGLPPLDARIRDWVEVAMTSGRETGPLLVEHHVVHGTSTACENSPNAPSCRDRAFFVQVRDDIIEEHRATLQVILRYYDAFNVVGTNQPYLQSAIEAPATGWSEADWIRYNRWKILGDSIHEYLHVLSHPDFRAGLSATQAANLGIEGFTEFLARRTYDRLRQEALNFESPTDLAMRVEGASGPDIAIPERRSYTRLLASVHRLVNDGHLAASSIMMAYFLGRLEFIGLGSWNAADAEQHADEQRPVTSTPENELGMGLLLDMSGNATVRARYTRVLASADGEHRFPLGGDIEYLPSGHRVSLAAGVSYELLLGDFVLQIHTDVQGGLSLETPSGSERIDFRPGVQAGVQIGIFRIFANGHLLVPLHGGSRASRLLGGGGGVTASLAF